MEPLSPDSPAGAYLPALIAAAAGLACLAARITAGVKGRTAARTEQLSTSPQVGPHGHRHRA